MKRFLIGVLAMIVVACTSYEEQEREHYQHLNVLAQSTTVKVTTLFGNGSGVIIAPNLVLTAYHVVEMTDQAEGPIILFTDDLKHSSEAKVVAGDFALDIALLELESPMPAWAPLSDELPPLLSKIYISGFALGRKLHVTEGFHQGFLPEALAQQASAHIIFGNSGGPVYWYDTEEERFEVVGIATSMAGHGGTPVYNMSYYTGIESIHKFLKERPSVAKIDISLGVDL